MDDPNAALYLVKDFQDHGPGTWRWAYAHPVLRFFVPDVPQLKFTMDFSLPDATATGQVIADDGDPAGDLVRGQVHRVLLRLRAAPSALTAS